MRTSAVFVADIEIELANFTAPLFDFCLTENKREYTKNNIVCVYVSVS